MKPMQRKVIFSHLVEYVLWPDYNGNLVVLLAVKDTR